MKKNLNEKGANFNLLPDVVMSIFARRGALNTPVDGNAKTVAERHF